MVCKNFFIELQHTLANYDDILSRFVFSDVVSFHLNGKVNRHNVWEELDYSTGAQEWHILSMLSDVTSPTTVAHYVSMTSNLHVLITEKH